MKNRAKCNLCDTIIESLHPQDYQLCKCGSIFVDGGPNNLCGAKDWKNFVRIDDNGNEHIPKIIEKSDTLEEPVEPSDTILALTKQDKLSILKEMIDGYDRLPPHAHGQPITHYDLQSALMIIYEILRTE
jgi:hypothetical protein